jgi:choline dehydrogenase-like flavoprotein
VADTFDFIVAGGGSAGCAVASRLSEDPKTSVALIEAGGRDDNWVVTTPGALALMVPSKINNWAFDTRAGLNGRIGYQPRGKGLGGPSSINAMVYIRGHKRDYDQWASLGNTGWSFADVLPIFKRSEHKADFDGEYHGKGGPLHVNKLRMMIRSYKWAATFRHRRCAPLPFGRERAFVKTSNQTNQTPKWSSPSIQQIPAVHGDDASGHVARGTRRQQHDGAVEVGFGADAALGNPLGELFA